MAIGTLSLVAVERREGLREATPVSMSAGSNKRTAQSSKRLFPSRLAALVQIYHHLFPSSAYSRLVGGVGISKPKKVKVHLYISQKKKKKNSAGLPYIYIT